MGDGGAMMMPAAEAPLGEEASAAPVKVVGGAAGPLAEMELTEEAKMRGPSPLRRLAPLLQVEDIIWLAGGLPNAAAFPLTSLTATLYDGTVIEIGGAGAGLLYDAQQYMTKNLGHSPLVGWCEEHMRLLHGALPNHRCILTAGSTCSGDLAMRLLCESGRTVMLTEWYTYPNFTSSVKPLGVPIVPVAMDEGGLVPAAMEESIRGIMAGASPPSSLILYIGTCGQNPTGHTYSRERLTELYAVARRHDVIIIEDDPYMYLSFPRDGGAEAPGLYGLSSCGGGGDRCSLLSIDEDARVIRMDTFSKVSDRLPHARTRARTHSLAHLLTPPSRSSSRPACAAAG